MSKPSAKQVAYAARLFARQNRLNEKRTGHVNQYATFADEMTALGWDANNCYDVSSYIDLYRRASLEAAIITKGGH
jgi:hypothetical protein